MSECGQHQTFLLTSCFILKTQMTVLVVPDRGFSFWTLLQPPIELELRDQTGVGKLRKECILTEQGSSVVWGAGCVMDCLENLMIALGSRQFYKIDIWYCGPHRDQPRPHVKSSSKETGRVLRHGDISPQNYSPTLHLQLLVKNELWLESLH